MYELKWEQSPELKSNPSQSHENDFDPSNDQSNDPSNDPSQEQEKKHGFGPPICGGGERSAERWEKDCEPTRKREDLAPSLHRKPGGECVGNSGADSPLIAVHTGIWATLKWKGKMQPQQAATQALWQWKSVSLLYKLK